MTEEDLKSNPHCEECGALPETRPEIGPPKPVYFGKNKGRFFYLRPFSWKKLCSWHRREEERIKREEAESKKKGRIKLDRLPDVRWEL